MFVDANSSAAFWALPALFFFFDKRGKPMESDEFQVFKHAHAIFCSIPFVQMLQAGAGDLRAFTAKAGLGLLNLRTIFNLAVKTHGGLIRIIDIAAWTMTFPAQISHANSAIHSAGGDQSRFNRHAVSPVSFKAFY